MNKKQYITRMNNIAKGVAQPARTQRAPQVVKKVRSVPVRAKVRTSFPLVPPVKRKVVPGETKRGYTKYA